MTSEREHTQVHEVRIVLVLPDQAEPTPSPNQPIHVRPADLPDLPYEPYVDGGSYGKGVRGVREDAVEVATGREDNISLVDVVVKNRGKTRFVRFHYAAIPSLVLALEGALKWHVPKGWKGRTPPLIPPD